jgi:agmatinase
MKILRGVADLNIVGADIVEVAPAYDSPGADTAFIVRTCQTSFPANF